MASMVFSSPVFLFYFLPLFLVIYYWTRPTWRAAVLTFFSYVFYGWWNWRFVFLMLLTTTIDYHCGGAIAGFKSLARKRFFLLVSITANLTLLGFFKYFNFFTDNTQSVLQIWGLSLPDSWLSLNVVLPVGISFYTFQSMSYSIDIYRGYAKPSPDFLSFASYISMFPQLVAGPIIRYSYLAEQLLAPKFSTERFYLGLQYFIFGLAKKVLIADPTSFLADGVFNWQGPQILSSLETWLGLLAYTVQIYFDFSGYSDMAVGLGLFCGFSFPINFDSPYKSASITEFWRRWHITLSTWLRDNLYIPMGGSHYGTKKTYRNLIFTMLLGGLWHGASWNFVIWGGLHGAYLAAERALGERNGLQRLPSWLQVAVTFLIIAFTWIFFRATTLQGAVDFIGRLLTSDWSFSVAKSLPNIKLGLGGLVVGLVIIFTCKNTWHLSTAATWPKTIYLALLFVLSIIFLFGSVTHPFLYFQF